MNHLITAAGAVVLGAAAATAYAQRERVRGALMQVAVGNHSVIANCIFDGTVSVRGPLRYCAGNKFNVTGLSITS